MPYNASSNGSGGCGDHIKKKAKSEMAGSNESKFGGSVCLGGDYTKQDKIEKIAMANSRCEASTRGVSEPRSNAGQMLKNLEICGCWI